jgi:hypothetical protein
VTAESTVQYSASGITSFTNTMSGYDKIKSYTLGTPTPCKSYLKFDFTGLNPNTNYSLKFTFVNNGSGGSTHLNIWALNQDFASFVNSGNPAISALNWTNAQANNTNNNTDDLLTSGGFTGTLVNSFLNSSSSAGTTVTATLPPPWGQYLFGNKLVIVLTAANAASSGDSSSACRFKTNTTTVAYQPLTPGTLPPTISAISARTNQSGVAASTISFTASDPVDSAATLLSNITISLGNTNITLTSSNISYSGIGNNFYLDFTPVNNLNAGQTATTTITLTVTDSNGNSATSSFLLTVPPSITLPYFVSGTNVNYLPPTNRAGIGPVTISFQVVDTNFPASSLQLTATASAYSTNLGGISISKTAFGSSTNLCTVTVTNTGSGVGIINLSATDPTNSVSTTVSVAVMFLPDSSYALCDLMNYQPSTSYSSSSGHADLLNVTAGLWAARSTSGTVNLLTSVAGTDGGAIPGGVPLIRGTASGNQNQLHLAGAPYTAGSHKVIFASINAQWCDASPYGANQYFPSNSTGAFVELAADASSSGVAMAAVSTVINPSGYAAPDGQFYLALYNGTNAPTTNTTYTETIPHSPNVLPNSVSDNIVMSYDLDTGISTLWVNQANSAAASVSTQDVAVTNLANVSYLVLRQNGGMGQILIEGAAVKVVTKPIPAVTASTKSGNTFQINFTCTPGTAATASVVGSSTVDGIYSPVAATITEPTAGNFVASITTADSQMFYRIKQTASAPTVTFPF